MKYLVESTQNKEFSPYKVTFFINTKEESEAFHDNVAIKIESSRGKSTGDLIKTIYQGAGKSGFVENSGEI